MSDMQVFKKALSGNSESVLEVCLNFNRFRKYYTREVTLLMPSIWDPANPLVEDLVSSGKVKFEVFGVQKEDEELVHPCLAVSCVGALNSSCGRRKVELDFCRALERGLEESGLLEILSIVFVNDFEVKSL